MTDGVWEEVDPADTNAADGFARIQVPVKDITVNLATDAAGVVTTTAKQVVDAINAHPAAQALVTAYTFANNAGDGVVVPTPSRSYNFPLGTSNTGQTYTSTRARLLDGIRGGTVYWTGNATATPSTLARTDSRYVTRGPFQPKVYRIGKDRSNNAVGVFLYCQQHAREWVTPITCVETAQRLVKNYATDPTTKEYVDKLNVFIIPSVNPDGGHAAFHENSVQRKNLTNYCPITESTGGAGSRFQWGVDLNRNNTVGTLFDGYDGASTSCTSETFTGPGEASEPEIKNEHWVGDTFKGIKFANNIHTHGGYFMWAPGAYKDAGRETLPAPNIGIENYFFDVADTILSHIRSSRNTAILPQRVGPIADTLYSAAGNSSDEGYYKRGIIGYSFEAGAQRITVNETTGAISKANVGFQPCFARPGHQRRPGLDLHHGQPARAEPADGQRRARLHDGVRRGQLRHDRGRPRVPRGRHRADDDDRVLGRADERRPDQLPVQLGQRARGHLLHDRRLQSGRRAGRQDDGDQRELRQHGGHRHSLLQQPGSAHARRGADARPRRPHGQVDGGGHQGQPRGRQVPAAPGRRG